MISGKYTHKGSGRIYEVIRSEDFLDFTIKQSSGNLWENIVAYMDVTTLQPFITGEKRFKAKFEKIE